LVYHRHLHASILQIYSFTPYMVYVLRFNIFSNVGWDSSVSIATHYRLDSPGIASHWGQDLLKPVQTRPGVEWLGRGIDHPPSPSTEVKQRVGVYLHSPSGPSWPVLVFSNTVFF
jgi:hypothetical protein